MWCEYSVMVWAMRPCDAPSKKWWLPAISQSRDAPERTADHENVQTWRRAATKKNSDVDQLFKDLPATARPAMNVPRHPESQRQAHVAHTPISPMKTPVLYCTSIACYCGCNSCTVNVAMYLITYTGEICVCVTILTCTCMRVCLHSIMHHVM